MTPDTPADLADLLDAHAHELEEFTSSRPDTDTHPVAASTYRKAAQTIRAMEQPAMPARKLSGDPAIRLADDARFMASGAYPAKVSDLVGIADDINEVLAERSRLRALSEEAIRLMTKYAREAGEATGKLETSELAGIVDDWKARAIKAETALKEAVKALGKIDRMKLFYDAAINQTTLSSAIQIARATLAAILEDAA